MRFFRTTLPLLIASILELVNVTYAQGYGTVIHGADFVPDAILRVSEEEVKQSCVPSKPILVVNGTSPGPELRFMEGKTVWIRVYNDIPHENLTMHWHGLTMATAPFSDGTPQAAQWPIPPHHYFDHQLHVPKGMAGTYFYHSHVGFQAISVTGPLTITDDGGSPYEYDGEKILLLQDVFPQNDTYFVQGLLSVPLRFTSFQTMVLINGKGGGIASTGITTPSVPCNESLAIINVDPGKCYRFRLIGGTALSFNTMAFEDHDELTIIEADAAYVVGYNTPFIQIGPGQRFSFILCTKEKPEKQFYYMQLESRELGSPVTSYAVLNYGSLFNASTPLVFPPATPALTLPPTDSAFLDYKLRPLNEQEHMPSADEVTRRVNITFNLDTTNGFLYRMNNYTWNEETPEEPYLVSLYKSDGEEWPSMERALQHDGLDPETVAFPADIGEVLEIVVQGTGSTKGTRETHPWHAHGAHYWDLGSGDGVYDRAANEAMWKKSPGKPVKRDTTMIYKYDGKAAKGELAGWRAWRIKVTEPGVWMIHCHLLVHMVWGMNTVWVMGNSSEVLGKVPYPQVAGYLDYGGSVYGNATNPPEVVDYFPYSTWSETP